MLLPERNWRGWGRWWRKGRKEEEKKEMADGRQAEQDMEYGMGIKKRKEKRKKYEWLVGVVGEQEIDWRQERRQKKEEKMRRKKQKKKRRKIKTKIKRKEKASKIKKREKQKEKEKRRRRGEAAAPGRGGRRGKKREKEKEEKRKKKECVAPPGLRSAPVVAKPTSPGRRATRQPCRLHPRAKLCFAFGLRVGEAAAGQMKEMALKERPGGGWKGRLKIEKWKKSGSREDVGNKKGEEKGWDDGAGCGGWRCVRRRPAKPGGRKLAGEGLWGWYEKKGGGRCWLAGWRRKGRCWRPGV